jgi:hypothetical protein
MSISVVAIVYAGLFVAAAWCGAKGVRIPLLTPAARWWNKFVNERLGGARFNAWVDRKRRARRARKYLPLAEQLEKAGMPEQAKRIRGLVR